MGFKTILGLILFATGIYIFTASASESRVPFGVACLVIGFALVLKADRERKAIRRRMRPDTGTKNAGHGSNVEHDGGGAHANPDGSDSDGGNGNGGDGGD